MPREDLFWRDLEEMTEIAPYILSDQQNTELSILPLYVTNLRDLGLLIPWKVAATCQHLES